MKFEPGSFEAMLRCLGLVDSRSESFCNAIRTGEVRFGNRSRMQTSLIKLMETAAVIFRALACIASVAMLLTFPMIKPHSFTDQFRAPELPWAIVQHTQIAAVENATVESIVQIGIEPYALPLVLDFKTKYATTSNVGLAFQASPTRLFLRFKGRREDSFI